VTLTASPDSMWAAGDISLVTTATGANGVAVRKVEFFESTPGSSPQKIGEDSDAPYEFKRAIASAAENGDRIFTAKAYDEKGQVGTSSSSLVHVGVGQRQPSHPVLSSSHTRITTSGKITFTLLTNPPAARAELFNGTTKIAETSDLPGWWVPVVAVTAADNGTQTYVAKIYDAANNLTESTPVSVVVDIRWDLIRTIDGLRNDGFPRIAVDAANNLYIAGTSDGHQVYLTKHDADGNLIWLRRFGGGGWENIGSVNIDAAGRIYIAGDNSPTVQRTDCFLTLYDETGALLRSQLVDVGTSGTYGCQAVTDAAGNFYVGGGFAVGSQTNDIFVAKYDKDGALFWTRFVGSSPGAWNDDFLRGIAVDGSGSIYVTGLTHGSFDGTASGDLFVLKFDADGNRVWSRQFGFPGVGTGAQYAVADPDGGVYVAGLTDDPNNPYRSTNAFIVRYSANGTLLWTRTLDGGDYDTATGVAADRRGVYLVGLTNRSSGGLQITEPRQASNDGFLATFARDGTLTSVRLLSGPGGAWANSVAIGANGDLYTAGSFFITPMFARHHGPVP
jgi:hypothetical protein